MSSETRWKISAFQALSVADLYAWLALRARVFVVEQACAYQDPDGLDPESLHVLGWRGSELVAGARVLPPGLAHGHAAIGRAVTAPERRREGLGQAVFERALGAVHARWGAVPVHLGAQAHLADFYRRFGFELDGAPYLEDGIPHVPMTGLARTLSELAPPCVPTPLQGPRRGRSRLPR
jgi:ElaA protein